MAHSALLTLLHVLLQSGSLSFLTLLHILQHEFFPGDGYLEIDFDVHQYTYLARRAITTYMSRLRPVIWETAFIIQVS